MSKRPRVPGAPDVHSLAMMLDYAIIEGAELRLPLFVLLLRAARLELMNCIEPDGPTAIEPRRRLTPPPHALAVLDEAPASSPSSLQDR